MFKQIILPIFAVIIFIVIVGVFVQKSPTFSLSNLSVAQPTTAPQGHLTIGSKIINVEVADTSDKRSNGLSGRSSLNTDSGMLFVFDTKGVTPLFWMKDTLIPLDFIWIRSSSGDVGNGKVVRIDNNVPIPTPGTSDNDLKTYSAGQPIDYVLEVNAGFSNQNNIKVGDIVNLSGI